MARLIEAVGYIMPLVPEEAEEKIKKHRKILKLLNSIKNEPRSILSAHEYIEKFDFKSGEHYLYSVDDESNSVFVGNHTHYARYEVSKNSLTLFEGEAIEMTNEEEAKLHYASLIAIRTASVVLRQRLYEVLL
ncbi:hypothetical protein L1267_15890 [Pseudoalteromonas sp. OFAV1]|uniref:hypothetical protein n=1 Tax=Pseudoalteromonas sp. OFAV1 TaxID=2908892 RepID=UPI001F340F4C|nr:hypothetical protein [Pseudoalteromonas sp. OFAV1]MCF2901858.1 hypothetical protein [Pseudoalteromonas sp. OFAV1]